MARSRFALVFLATAMAMALPMASAKAEAGIASFNTSCKSDFRKWKKQRGWKAFAVSNIYLVKTTEWQSCGYGYQYATKTNAVKVALLECRAELKKRRAPKSAYCAIKSVGG